MNIQDRLEKMKTIKDEIKANGKCNRCNGTGIMRAFTHVHNGVCFACWGIGYRVTVTQDIHTVKPGDMLVVNSVLFKVVDIIWKNKYKDSDLFYGTQDLVGNQAIVMIRARDGKMCSLPRIEINTEQSAEPAPEDKIGQSIF